jgi:hypothetical protein
MTSAPTKLLSMMPAPRGTEWGFYSYWFTDEVLDAGSE